MAQFDVFELAGGTWVVEIQANLIPLAETTVVVPLMPPDHESVPVRRLHPTLTIADQDRVLATHLITVVRRQSLKTPIGSLVDDEYEIKAALDLLISGI